MPLYEETKRIQQELDNKYNQDDPLKYLFTKLSTTNKKLASVGKPTIIPNVGETSAIYLPKDSRNFGRFFGEVYDPTTNIENVAAGRQSGAERLAYMLPRIGVKVASEVAQLPGYLAGAVAWGTTGFDKDQVGLMVDNFWQRAVQSAEETVKGGLPVYVSDKVKEGNLLQNIFSTSFWATEGADGIGFLLSYLVPGQALKATGLGAKAARLMKPGNKISKLLSEGMAYESAVNAATKGTKEAFDFVGATVINTLFESAAEGGETYRNILDKTGDKEKAAIAAVDVVNKNFGILLASNAVDQYWLFKDIKMFKKASSDVAETFAKKSVLDKLIDPKTNKVLSEIAPRTKWEKAGILTKDFFTGLGKEGFYEEGMQFAASKQAEKDLDDPEAADRGFLEGLVDLGETYLDSLSDTDMQKSIFLGGLLGGGMSMIHTQREQATEKRLLEGTKTKTPSPFAKFFGARERKETPGLKQLIERKMGSLHLSLADLAETEVDKDGNVIPKLNSDGTYIWDAKKVESLAEDKIIDYAEKEKLVSFAKSGNLEGFKQIKDKMDFRYMSNFIQQEGGINTLIRHIDELSELEKEYFQKEGVDFDLNKIKEDLKTKAFKFQALYDRVNNTHDLLMDDVKTEKGDKAILQEYSDLVRNNKVEEERISLFSDSRISSLRRELSDLKYNETPIPITSDQNNLSNSLIESLNKSYSESKDKLSDASRKQVERTIKDIDEHQKELKRSREFSSKLYNKKWLNTTFKEFKDRKKAVRQSTVDGNKAQEAVLLNPKLRALYDKAIIMEEFNEPVKAVARHSGEIQVNYTDNNGKSHRIVGVITGPTTTGNLRLKAVKEEIDGTFKNIENGSIFFLNSNDTINLNKTDYKIDVDGINIVKTPEEILNKRRNTKLLEILKDQLDKQRNTIKNFKEQLLLQNQYIEELKEKALELDNIELELLEKTGSRLTSKGTARKISVKIAIASKNFKSDSKKFVENKKRQFLNAEELRIELQNAIRVHNTIKIDLETWSDNKKRISDLVKQAKEEGNFFKLFEKEVETSNQLYNQMQRAIEKNQEVLDNSNLYLKRLHSTLKGYITSFANIFGITPQLTIIRNNPELTLEEIEEQSISLISNTLSSIELTDSMIEALGILPTNVERIQELINQKNNEIAENKALLANNSLSIQQLYEIANIYNLLNKKFTNEYVAYLGQIGVTEAIVDEDLIDEKRPVVTPEDNIEELRSREEVFTRSWEEASKHPYINNESFIVTGGNQLELMRGSSNDDLARWYIFVNKLAHQGNNKKYIFKSFTISQVADLKEDDPIRKHLKFYAGKIKGIDQYVTYTQLLTLPSENQKIASEDIKIVVHDQDSKPVLFSKQVIDNSENKYYLIYNSLLENSRNLFGNRFSKEKAITDKLKQLNLEDNKDNRSKVTAIIDDQFDKDWNKYLQFREDLKKQSYFLGINFVNPGIKNYDEASEIELNEFTGVENISQLSDSVYIHKIGERTTDKRDKNIKQGNFGHRITRNFSGAEHGVTSGYAYLGWDNRYELIKPRTLGDTGSVEEVINILRYLATNPKDYEEVEQYLHKLIYINASSKKYRIYFAKFWGADRTKHGFRSLLYGDKELSATDLANGENLEDLREFLTNKYWNFDDKSLKETSFTEYKVTWTGNKPVVTSKLWDSKQGSYVGFLFSNDNGNRVPKGTIHARKVAQTPLDNARSPQFINQSLSLTKIGTSYKKANPIPSNKTNSDPQEKKVSKGGLREKAAQGIVDKNKLKLGRKPIEDSTETTKESIQKTKKTLRNPSFGVQTAPDAADNITEPVSSSILYKNADDFWNSLSKEARNIYVSRFNKPEEEVKKIVYYAYSQPTGDLNRVKNQNEDFIQEELDSKIEWFRNKFTQIPLKVIEDSLMGDSWGRLTRQGKILISDLAAEGTIYHEAYHTYSLLFQDESSRNNLYNEVRQRLNKELTDKQAEEFLAEEFRMYMYSPNEYKFNKGEELRKNWFQKLLDYILDILQEFNIIKSDKPGWRIEETFNKINITESFVIEDELLKERIKNIRENYDRTRTIEGFTERETMHYIQDFNFNFFQTLFNPKSLLNPDTLFDLDVNIEDLYNTLYTFYDINRKNNPSYEKIFKNFNDIRIKHSKFLQQYGISLSENYTLKENEIEGATIDEDDRIKTKTEFLDSVQINMNELLDNPIRMVIAGLPAVTLVNNMPRPTLSEYLTKSTTKYSSIITILRDNLAKLNSVEEMANKISELSNTYPELSILIRRLGLSDSGKGATTQQVALQNQLYKNFAMNRNNPILFNYTNDGKKYQINAVDNNVAEKIKNEWLNNARLNATTDVPVSYILKTKKGDYVIDLKILKRDLDYYNSIDKAKRLNVGIDILEGLGIKLPLIEHDSINNYLFWLSENLKDRTESTSIFDFYNSDVIKAQKEFNNLLEYASTIFINNKDLSYFNQDGNREYSVTMNSYLSNIVNLLGNISYDKTNNTVTIPNELEYLMGWDNTTGTGSLFNRNSIWLDLIKSGQKLDLVLLKGLISPTEGTEISKLVLGDYKSVTFNALLQGIVPFLRSADRKLEYGFRIGTINNSITNDIFMDTMHKYLKDELSTSFALLLDKDNWGGRLKNYSNNAKELRVFKFLQEDPKIPSLEEFVSINRTTKYDSLSRDEKTKVVTVEEVDRLVNKFLSTYNSKKNPYIDRNFTKYSEDLQNMTFRSLEEDSLIVKEQHGKGSKVVSYSIPGIDTETLKNIGVTPTKLNTITEESMKRLVRLASYNSFVGNNEQLKLFLGDLAYYRNATDFHKRTTGASSTKYSQRDDIFIREHMNNNFRRFDNKDRTDSMSMVIVEDILYNNEELSKSQPAYAECNSTDAQSWIMLDEYRDIMLRHGLWYPRHEKTYQYEMQKFALRIIKLSEEGRTFKLDIQKIKDQFTSPKGTFFNHTKGRIPSTPLYNGEELVEENLNPLSILKPQGFGHIANEELSGLNATTFWKTSAAPIFLSAIEDNSPMFDFLVNMMANKQSVLTFSNYGSGSAIKADLLGDTNGKIQKIFEKEDYFSQNLRYRDFGIQLDIHEESEGEVSVSTQRTRLEFLDVFNLGLSVKDEELAQNRHEYTKITNDIESQLRERLLNDLGIVKKGNNYLLPKENADKFSKKLISAFENRQLPLNVIDGLQIVLDSTSDLNFFDLSLSKFKIEEILTSLVRNELIKRKVYGEMLIQESAFLYENPNKNRLLEFYKRTFPDGKNKSPVITPMDVMIAVPRSILNYVKSIGGVDILNAELDKYYETGDYGKLGEDFIDLLTMPANRIPGQSLSSLDIIRVRKFLPHYHGNKVVIPAEATVKAGSDFDVDKLTVYFNEFFEGKEGLKYNYDDKSIKGKQNRLNTLAEESLLHPDRFNELVTPLDANYLKNKSKEIKKTKDVTNPIEIRSNNPTLSDVIHWWYNMQKGYEFWTSKSGVATVAVQNAAHAIEQSHSLVMNSVIPFMFEGQELNSGETYRSGFIEDASGRKVSMNFAEFLTAFVDAVKDPFIFEITDNDNFAAIAALNRFGKENSVGLDSIIEFYSQPIVKDYIKLKRVNSAKYMFFNQYNVGRGKWKFNKRLNKNKQYRVALQTIKDKLGSKSNISTSYEYSVSAAVEKYIQERTKIYTINESLEAFTSIENEIERHKLIQLVTDSHPDVEKRYNEIQQRITDLKYKYLSLQDLKSIKSGKDANGKNIDPDELFRLNVQVLDNYTMYNQLGWNLVTVNSFLRPDASSSFGRHLSAIDASINMPAQTIRRRGLFDYDSILNAIKGTEENPSLINEFFETKQNTSSYYAWSSLINSSPTIKGFFEKEVYSVFGNPSRRLNRVKLDSALQTVESDFISFLLVRMLGTMTPTEIQKTYKNIFKGDNSIAKQLLRVKSSIKNNMAIEELEAVISKKFNKSQTISELDNISFFSKQFDITQWDTMEADLYDLYNSTTDNKAFVQGLIYLSLFQSGYKKSPISFSEIIPNRIFIPMASVALKKFVELPESDQLNQLKTFMEQMYRNNADNMEITPRHSFLVDFNQTYISDKDGYHKNTDFLAANMYIGNPETYWDANRKAPMTVALYKRVNELEFKLISKLGDGMRFREYYPDATIEDIDNLSILDSNYYEFNIDNAIKEEKDTRISKNQVHHEEEEDTETDDRHEGLYFKPNYKQQTTKEKKVTKKSNRKGSVEDTLFDINFIDGKNSYASSFGEDNMLHPILRSIENRSDNIIHATLAKAIREEIRQPIPFRIFNEEWRESEPDERGKYNGYTKVTETLGLPTEIGIYDRLDDSSFEVVTLHEGIHALSIMRYKTDPIFRNKINNLFNHVKDYAYISNLRENIDVTDPKLIKMKNTLLFDEYEFISEALTNPEYQELLSTIPAYDETNIKDLSKSVFRQFIETLFDLFNGFFARNPEAINDLPPSAFKELISLVDDTITSPNEILDNVSLDKTAEENELIIRNLKLANKNNNEFELNKEKEVKEDFVKVFPGYAHLTSSEQDTLQEAVDKGEIQLACGL